VSQIPGRKMQMKKAILASIIALGLTASARAAIVITEVHPGGSGNSTYMADFFELTNTGAASVNIGGWKMDDNSNSFGSAVALRGVTSINPGQSVIFAEGDATGTTDATILSNFKTAWFGANTPAGFAMGGYGGSGVGLSTSGDAVNIFDSTGVRITGVSFGASTNNFTFDNALGLGGTTLPLPIISALSVAGYDNAFLSPTGEVGSPGAVPEPTSAALIELVVGGISMRRRNRSTKRVAV
jgi:hypothetical protein